MNMIEHIKQSTRNLLVYGLNNGHVFFMLVY
jgi:hypothetical protein